MKRQQRPGFICCVPIRHDPDWPGLAACAVEDLVRALGNPVNDALQAALDSTGCIHFMSLSVIWDERFPDEPPFLVLDVSADGAPEGAIDILVERAGRLLLPVFEAACGVATPEALWDCLRATRLSAWLWPFSAFHGTLGLAFQGTPGLDRANKAELTVGRITMDAKVEALARQAVIEFGRTQAGVTASALAYVREAVKAVERDEPCRGGIDAGEALDQPADQGAITGIWRVAFSAGAAYLPLVFLALTVLVAAYFGMLIGTAKAPDWVVHDFVAPVRGAAEVIAALGLVMLTVSLAVLTVVVWFGALLGFLAWRLRTHEDAEKPDDSDPDLDKLREIALHENKGVQNHLIDVSRIKPGFFRRFIGLWFGLYVVWASIKAKIFRPGFLASLGTIHFAQWMVLPGTKTLVFLSNYDGSWESYLEDFINEAAMGLNGIWSNTEGYPATRWLFLGGADDGDRFKRWGRRQQVPSLCWYSAYPTLTTQQIRDNVQVRVGMAQCKAGHLTETAAEGWLKLFGSAPRPAYQIETNEVQGLVLNAYRDLLESTCLLIRLPGDQPEAVRAWLGEAKADVSFDTTVGDSATILGLSAQGFAALGLRGVTEAPPARGVRLAADFSFGLFLGWGGSARARFLGYVGAKAPTSWGWGGPNDPIGAVLLLYAKDPWTLARTAQTQADRLKRHGLPAAQQIRLASWPAKPAPITEPFGFVDGISQPVIAGLTASIGAAPNDLLNPGEFILGYQDARQHFPPTPQAPSSQDPQSLLPDLPAGFPSAAAGGGATRDLGQNGSYLVIRQLRQNVRGFNDFIAGAAGKLTRKVPNPQEWLAAKMVGRWKNGAPLVLHPDEAPQPYDSINADNSFLFGRQDPQGLGCPIGAHVRRANIRDGRDANDPSQIEVANRHRILRRGRAYVEGDDPHAERQGLLFMCLNADIQRQFEFVQQTWLSANAFTGLQAETDPIVAAPEKAGIFTIPTLTGPERVVGLTSFVTPVGGGYFFLPSKSALGYLSTLGSSASLSAPAPQAAASRPALRAIDASRLPKSQRLLVRVRSHPLLGVLDAERPFDLPGYALKPLSPLPPPPPTLDLRPSATRWMVATPDKTPDYATPWDHAHAIAKKHGYRHYVEPDILHYRPRPPRGHLSGGFDPNWPPNPPPAGISPAWHLGEDFTGLAAVRGRATGRGMRIAHLDTGYIPGFLSNPRNLAPELGYDFWDGKSDPVDAETTGLLDMPGHGTGTAAILAGGAVDLTFNGARFQGDLGAAPDATVIPIRIGPSVIAAWTASMAQGIELARERECEVVSISHGGAPTQAWADMVNQAYEAGVTIVAASGDNIVLGPIDFASRFVAYPSAFNRVITAVGATYDKGAYTTAVSGEIQGCWGPDEVMGKAIAAYAPNVVWMVGNDPPLGFEMHGGGTSIAAPQIAGACALWLELYGPLVPERSWLRVEACGHALFMSADKAAGDASQLGEGLLRVPEMLDPALARQAIARARAQGPSQPDSVDFALFRLLAGFGPPGSDVEERMYETESAQAVHASTNPDLHAAAHRARELRAAGGRLSDADQRHHRALLHAEPLSEALKRRLPV